MSPTADLPWLHWLDQTSSTNSWAIEHQQLLQHGDVVFTPQQTAGRGQFDRVWHSPPGVLTASVILDGLDPRKHSGLSLAMGLAVIYAIEDLAASCQNNLQLKWPNDICYHQRKLAGILCEFTQERLIVGIGCNLQVDFVAAGVAEKITGNPLSLHQIHPDAVDPLALLAKLRHYLLEAVGVLQHSGLELLLPAIQNRDALRDRSIAIESPQQTIQGIGVGINALGHLQIRLANQQVQSFAAGRVCWLE
jgi:BirA family transcriptional regulator, biotin operon repressor / biotin---[acetyl-CoA-carboxylase] ligase